MNLLDIILLIPMCWMVYRGWSRGAIRSLTTLVGIVAGVWAAVHLSQKVAERLDVGGEASLLVAFFICFVGALVLAYLLGKGVERLLKAAHISIVNRVVGAVLGLATAVCVLSVALGYVDLLQGSKESLISREVKEKSLMYKPVSAVGSRVSNELKDYVSQHSEQWKEALL